MLQLNYQAPDAPKGPDTAKEIDVNAFKDNSEIDKTLDALENENFNQEVVAPDTETVTPPTEETKPEQVQPETPKEVSPEAPTETPKDTPQKDTDFILTDDRLSTLSDKQRKYLAKYKDKSLNDILDALANSQELIGAKAEKLKQELLSDFQPEKPTPESQMPPIVDETDAVKAKDEFIMAELHRRFSDMPKDPEERKAWIRNLNIDDPERYDEFKEVRKQTIQEVDTIFTQTKYLRENYPSINKERIAKEVAEINDYFVNQLKINPKDYGYDLNIDPNGENPLINELLIGRDGKLDPLLVDRFNGIPIVKEGGLSYKFFRSNLPKIKTEIEARARLQGYNQTTKKEVAPTLGLSKPGTQQMKQDITQSRIGSLTSNEEIDKYLDQLDNE